MLSLQKYKFYIIQVCVRVRLSSVTYNKAKVGAYLSVIVLQLQVHLYSVICHLQVVSHGTIAYIDGSRAVVV